jgi:hypothetical protein
MNCKPGELARFVNSAELLAFGLERLVDRIVKLTVLVGTSDDGKSPAWGYEGARIEIPVGFTVYVVEGIADRLLRPIRGGETPEESTEAMRDLTSIPSEVTA